MDLFDALMARLNPKHDEPTWQQTYAEEIAAIKRRSEDISKASKDDAADKPVARAS